MRAVTAATFISTVIALGASASADVRAGSYICRLPSGTETGRSFELGANGTYGGLDGTFAGGVALTGRELRFDGGGKDGNRALVISDTRIKVGPRVICDWQQPEAAPAAKPQVETSKEPESARAKLIVVKPDLRR